MQSQTVLITGATSGIGRHAALHLLHRGHRVFATGRDLAALQELEQEAADPRLTTLRLDVNDPTSIAAAAARVLEVTDGAGVDVLVNNAGYAQGGAVMDVTLEAVRAQYETNVFGLLAVTHAFIEPMYARGRGRIINVSSLAGRMTLPTTGVYNSTKYAVESLSDAMRVELAAFGIEVVLVEPGTINTRFNDTLRGTTARDARQQEGRWAKAYERFDKIMATAERTASSPVPVSRALARAVEVRRPRARYIAPLQDGIGAAILRALPTRLFDFIRRKLIGM